jgi:hypothetical protein
VETRIALPTGGDSLLVRKLQPVNRIDSRICWSLVCDVPHELAMPAKSMPPEKLQRDGGLSAPCAASTGSAGQSVFDELRYRRPDQARADIERT